LEGGESFTDELGAAVDEAGNFGSAFEGAFRNFVVVGFVGLSQIGGIAIGDGAFLAHPIDGGAGIEATRKCDAYTFAEGKRLKNIAHGIP
jgi:hypothetical protein